MKHGTGILTSAEELRDACCTQQYVWEYIHNNINSSFTFPSRDSWKSSYMSSSIYSSWLSQTENYYNQYHNNVSFNGSSNKVDIGESVTISDSKGVLQNYDSFNQTIDGVTFSHTKGNNNLTITATNNSNSGKVLIKKTNNLGNSVANCNFELYKDESCTQKVASGTSANNGQILFDKLKVGTYFVKETSVPDGYLIDKTIKRVDVANGQTATVEFMNNEPTGKILIYKVNENGDKINNATFKITANENITNVAKTKTYYTKGQEVATLETKDGIASIENLPMGTYIVNEVKAPTGYLLNENTYTAKLEYKNSVTPVVEIKIEGVINKEPTGKISIIKRDSETGATPQGDAVFTNAKYEVIADDDIYNVVKTKKFYSKGDLVATRSMSEKGTTEDVENLPLGKYVVKETVSSTGYLLDTKEYKVELKYKDQHTKIISDSVTSNEIVKKMQVHIFKSGIKINKEKKNKKNNK